jgi:hypothetical protein
VEPSSAGAEGFQDARLTFRVSSPNLLYCPLGQGFLGIPDIGISALISNPNQLALDLILNSAILQPDYANGLSNSTHGHQGVHLGEGM